jgi:menaquinone-dependent protoporphyrinogen oxidase
MFRILIVYGTSEGQTARIAEYLADVIRGNGHVAYPVDLRRSHPPGIDDYDAVIVGSSVYMGKHQKYVTDFIRQHRPALEGLPSAFFSVSLAAHENTAAATREIAGYLKQFVQVTGWCPRKVAVFAGALRYTQYSLIKRWIMKSIARNKGSFDLDTSRDYEYTDWESVRRFAEEFLAMVPAESPELARAG